MSAVPQAHVVYGRQQRWYVYQGKLVDGPFSADAARQWAQQINDTLHLQDADAFADMERRHPGLPTVLDASSVSLDLANPTPPQENAPDPKPGSMARGGTCA